MEKVKKIYNLLSIPSRILSTFSMEAISTRSFTLCISNIFGPIDIAFTQSERLETIAPHSSPA